MNKLTACTVLLVAALLIGCGEDSPPEITATQPAVIATQPADPAGDPPADVRAPDTINQGERIYIVQDGDAGSFSGIALKVYGNSRHWRLIAQANPGVDPRHLKRGDQLFIPALAADDEQ